MGIVKIPIKTLNGGVARRATTKRNPKFVEEADNVLLTVERSAEKRPPISHISTGVDGDYLDVPNLNGSPPPISTSENPTNISKPQEWWNNDNLYFHYLDIDGKNRYCIIINRGVTSSSKLIRVFRMEPTEWVEEEFDRKSLDRGMFEYILKDNRIQDTIPGVDDSLDQILGSTSYGSGFILYNKRVQLDFLPDNSNRVIEIVNGSCANMDWMMPDPAYIHSGDKIKYKVADMFFVDCNGDPRNGDCQGQGGARNKLPDAIQEDLGFENYPPSNNDDPDKLHTQWQNINSCPDGGGYKNVQEDIEYRVNSATMESYSVGHSVENFKEITIPPGDGDRTSHNGWKSQAALQHLYHRKENGIDNGSIDGATAATATVTWLTVPTGWTHTDYTTDNEFVIMPMTNAEGDSFLFKLSLTLDHVTDGSVDNNGRYIVGLNGAGDVDTLASRLAVVVNAANTNDSIKITASSTDGVVTLTQTEVGNAGNQSLIIAEGGNNGTYNETVTTQCDASDANCNTLYITLAGFSGGADTQDGGYLSSPFPNIRDEKSVWNYPFANNSGKGEVWYTREPFFSFATGFYRTVSSVSRGQPYFQQVRAEDKNSVLDHRTFPVNIYKDTDGIWKCRYVPLKPKITGSSINNPGPLAVGSKEKIKAIEFWKGRLWIATESSIFASRTNDFFNFFIDDISNINDSDPIDISVNTGQFNLIQSLTSFQNFLFITTQSGTQFELRGPSIGGGGSGAISPTSVELRSTSFYSTASSANPVKMGNSIFFFDTERLYLYSGSDQFGNEYSTAFEMSQHCDGYLPKKLKDVAVIPALDTIIMASKDNNEHNELYFYTSKSNGKELIQTAFYKWILDPEDKIQSIHGFEGHFYIIVKRSVGPGNKLVPYYATMEQVTNTTPLLDRLVHVDKDSVTYDMETNFTTVRLPYFDPNATEVVLYDSWQFDSEHKSSYTRHKATAVQQVQFDGHYKTELLIPGNVDTQWTGTELVERTVWAGRPYEMNIELSEMHVRDRDDVAQEGVLNLKRITAKHRDTGQYKIKVQRYKRSGSTVRSESFTFDDSTDELGGLRIEKEGELLSKVLGMADSTSIRITSLFPTPCNITSLEVIGNFRPGDTSIKK